MVYEAESMADHSNRGDTQSSGLLVLVVLLALVGLGLYIWLAPRTPVVAVPAETELSS